MPYLLINEKVINLFSSGRNLQAYAGLNVAQIYKTLNKRTIYPGSILH